MGQNFSSEFEPPLQRDLRQLMNDERFYDIALECSDREIIFGCKGILATRSKIFDKLIFSGLENNILSFNNINSNSMKVIVEYLYVSKVKKENLTVDNIIEVYHASIHFELIEFQSYIIDQVKEFLKSENEDTGKKLLSKCVDVFSLEEVDNEMSRILVDWIAMNKLKINEIDSLSLEGLKYFLMKTFNTEKPFATPEIELWDYILTKTKREEMYDQQGVQKYLIPLARYINLNRMDAEEIKQHIEPFNIYSDEELKEVYFSMAVGKGLGFIRGVPIFKWKNRGFGLNVSNGGFTVEASKFIQPISILGDLVFKGRGVYEWSIIIEKLDKTVYIGICDNKENLNNIDKKYHGWVLGSDGYVYHERQSKKYDAKFKEGDEVTIYLDMKMRTCAFSVNKSKKFVVCEWENIPSQVCPIASLGLGSKLRVKQELIIFSS
ncbi:hypothetical protein RclHR1_01520020 [Rhizophagus clarus]|uniref:Concanavalin A-like lectin/glucanase domain-containing protein n=1 Tax=Rhizophagus clarus TaxID=94130 RepID=A0A2Z6QGC6_9GLOM|nr:hypothetical protein RclHR1_01520020 [Rhizophagus clarus]GES78715.1 concanavalin A-like lectin/glucanase domain-containing protein [Rhizophagus clarus]